MGEVEGYDIYDDEEWDEDEEWEDNADSFVFLFLRFVFNIVAFIGVTFFLVFTGSIYLSEFDICEDDCEEVSVERDWLLSDVRSENGPLLVNAFDDERDDVEADEPCDALNDELWWSILWCMCAVFYV